MKRFHKTNNSKFLASNASFKCLIPSLIRIGELKVSQALVLHLNRSLFNLIDGPSAPDPILIDSYSTFKKY